MRICKMLALAIGVFMLISCVDRYNENPAEVIKDAVVDIDGNHYDAVKIGDQIWMASNLRTTRFADGTEIQAGNADHSDTIAYRYAPANSEAYVEQYGYLYNGAAVLREVSVAKDQDAEVQGVCPDGWHVPSHATWKAMVNAVKENKDYMHGSISEAKALAAPYGWDTTSLSNVPGRDLLRNNATGFNALPAGCYAFGYYNDQGKYAYFWTSSRISEHFGGGRSIGYDKSVVNNCECSLYYGLSVRCVKNNP